MRRRFEWGWTMLFSFIFISPGAIISVYGWHILQDAQASQNWPSIRGEIVASMVTENKSDEGTTYYADVTFEYVVNNQRYSADQVNFGQLSSFKRQHAQDIVDRYQEGDRILVYYNPEMRETAVLEPGVTWRSNYALILGLIFTIVSGISMSVFLFDRH